ncbi:MAG: InlB B-repeat-containing protein, partial [Clostridia bacterium]|nr:InlB B-repeat-containing protein [Clostridia bacterium]
MQRKALLILAILALVAIILAVLPASGDPAFYVVSYDGNGTTVYVDEQAKYPGQDLVLADNKPTWRGHFFLGWAASPDAAAAEYQPGDTFTVDESTVLYAVWMDCADLGTVSGNGSYTVSYPITKRFAYVAFTVETSGKYVIRSTGEYYRNNSATTRLEYEDGYGYWTSDYIDKVNHDFERLFDLEAGKQYYLFYYHTQEPLQLEFLAGINT